MVLEKKIFKFRQYILKLSPLGNRSGPSSNKLESHSPRNILCQVWLKLVQWFGGTISEILSIYLSLEKGEARHFSFTQGCFVPILVKTDPGILEKKNFYNFFNVFTKKSFSPDPQGWCQQNMVQSILGLRNSSSLKWRITFFFSKWRL